MQKFIQTLPIIVVIAALSIIIYQISEERQAKKKPEPSITVAQKVTADQLPISEELPEKDRQLVARVFDAPEDLDASIIASVSATAALVSTARPVRLSEIEPVQPVKAEPLSDEWEPYFKKDFESLRTDAVLNPDSEQNRAVVKTLMQKRQQRLARDGR